MIQETSRAAYRDIKPKMNKKQQEVYSYILKNSPCCNFDISTGLNWPINQITPRVFELRKMNVILPAGVRTSKTGHAARFWRINDTYEFLPRFVKNPTAPVHGSGGGECPPRGCGKCTQDELFSKTELQKTQRIEDIYA